MDQGGQYAGMAVFDPGVSIAGMGGQYHRIWGSVSTGMSNSTFLYSHFHLQDQLNVL